MVGARARRPASRAACSWRRGAAVDRRAARSLLLARRAPSCYARMGPRARRRPSQSLQRSTLNARDARAAARATTRTCDNVEPHERAALGRPGQKPAHWVGARRHRRLPRHATTSWLASCVPAREHRFLDQPLTDQPLGHARPGLRRWRSPPGTYRIALLGPSHVMGSGVADGETFAALLEERLNRDRRRRRARALRGAELRRGRATRCSQQLVDARGRALAFQPDAVFITDSPRAAAPIVEHLLDVVPSASRFRIPAWRRCCASGRDRARRPGMPVPFDSRARSAPSASRPHALERSRAPAAAATDRSRRWTLAEIADVCAAHGVRAGLPARSTTSATRAPEAAPTRAAGASDAGFLVFDLPDVYAGPATRRALRLAAWDDHPNAAGHSMIAERLLRADPGARTSSCGSSMASAPPAARRTRRRIA